MVQWGFILYDLHPLVSVSIKLSHEPAQRVWCVALSAPLNQPASPPHPNADVLKQDRSLADDVTGHLVHEASTCSRVQT